MGILGKRSRKEKEPSDRKAKPNGDTNRELVEIELALMKYFRFEQNIVAFNVTGVSSILPLAHEADMLIVSRSGYLTEVEIKRTYADFCADFKKGHRHESCGLVKEFCYCVPVGILDKVVNKLLEEREVPSAILAYSEELKLKIYQVKTYVTNKKTKKGTTVNEAAGEINLYFTDSNKPIIRPADTINVRPLFLEQRLEVARLGAMRQYHLREKLLKAKSESSEPDSKLKEKLVNLEIILREYRERFKEETGYTLDEKEILYG